MDSELRKMQPNLTFQSAVTALQKRVHFVKGTSKACRVSVLQTILVFNDVTPDDTTLGCVVHAWQFHIR